MTVWDDPNREAVGVEPIWTGAGVTVEQQTAPQPGEFDPSEHTVDEVNAYLEAHPDDSDRVLTLEEAGKARVGILGG